MGSQIEMIKLPSLSRVAPGSKAILELPLGPTYLRVHFTAAGTGLAIAHVGRTTVKVNGKERMEWATLQRLAYLNAYFGRSADTVTDFCLHFFRAEYEGHVFKRAPGLGTKDLTTLHIELDLDAAFPADGTIEAWAEVDPEPQLIGAFIHVTEYPYNSAVSGPVEIDKLPRGPFYTAIHLFKADVSEVEVMANRHKVIEGTKGKLERAQKEASPKPRVPQTAQATHIDFVLQGDLYGAYPTGGLNDWRVKATLDTAGAMDIVTETLDVLS